MKNLKKIALFLLCAFVMIINTSSIYANDEDGIPIENEEIVETIDSSMQDLQNEFFVDENDQVNKDEIILNERIVSKDELDYEYFTQEAIVDDVRITLKAPKGALPEDSTLSVKKVILEKNFISNLFSSKKEQETQVTQDELNKIDEAVQDAKTETKETESVYIFDIKILDKNGNEIEPSKDVQILFAKDVGGNQTIRADVYHVQEDDGELYAEKLKTETEVIENENVSTAITDGFSYYQVEFTYNELQYVLPSDTDNNEPGLYTKVKLQDILEYVQLQGEVQKWEVSNKELFDIETIDDELYLVSYAPFDTNEWLKVTIDGVEYEIVVTDGAIFDGVGYCSGTNAYVVAICQTSAGNQSSVSGYGSAEATCGSGAQLNCYCYEDSGHSKLIQHTSSSANANGYASSSCGGCNYTPGSTNTYDCSGDTTATLTINANGGSCGPSQTRYYDAGTFTRTYTCNSYNDSSCSGGGWSGAVTVQGCSKSNDTTAISVTYDGNGGLATSTPQGLRYNYYTWDNNWSAGTSWSGTSNETWTATYTWHLDTGKGDGGYKVVTLPSAEKTGYEFVKWTTEKNGGGTSYNAGENVTVTGTLNLYAQWKYKVKNNSSIEIKGKAEGSDFDINPGEETEYYYVIGDTPANISFDDRKYYDIYTNDENGSIGTYAKRKTQDFVFTAQNDNGHSIKDTVSITVSDVDLENGDKLACDVTPTNSCASIGDFINRAATKDVTVSANSSNTLVFSVPEGSHLVINVTNNSEQNGFSNTKDYITLIETPEEYTKLDKERKSYVDELEKEYIVFKSQESDASENRDAMIIDNQYQRASYRFTSEQNAQFKLYRCLTDDCTVEYTVQPTEHDASYNYFAKTVSNEVEGESEYLATLTGTTGEWANMLDKYETYKLVQETLIKDRFYSWDSGYEIKANDYTGYNTGETTIELNEKSKAIKIDALGVTHDPVFAGNTFTTGTGGSKVISTMKQPYTEVNVKTVTGSNVPVSDIEMYFGASTDVKHAYENIYVAAPTKKEGITFSSGSGSGKALQPDIDYTGYLGGSWITDLSGDYAPFNGYLANESWYKEISLPMAHYQDKEQLPTDFNLVIDTAKLTLKAKADIGNVNAKFDVLVNNAQYSYGAEGENGEMIKSAAAIVMHLGDKDTPACEGNEINSVCLDDKGYYTYTLDIPTDKLLTVKHDDNNAKYYQVKQTCDVDTDKYACRSYVAESTTDDHIEYFDFTRKSSVMNITSMLQDVITDKDVINNVRIELVDTNNNNAVCDDKLGTYCNVWNEQADMSKWSEISDKYAEIEYDDNTNVYKTKMIPSSLTNAEKQIIIPAGMKYTISVTNEQTGNWLSNFINGLFGNDNGEGFKTIIDVNNGITNPDAAQNIRLITNSYQYSRFNVKGGKGIQVDIYDKDMNLVSTLTYAEDNIINVDLQYDLAPYTFKQKQPVSGYYDVQDVVHVTALQDAEYDVDMSMSKIEIELNAVGIYEDKKYPMTGVEYAIGDDEENIVAHGYTNAENKYDTSMLEKGHTYNVYFGGTTTEDTVSGYYDVREIVIPDNMPNKKPMAEGNIQLIKKTVSVNDIYGDKNIDVKVNIDGEWTYDDVVDGNIELNIQDGTSKEILIPKNMEYEILPAELPGYTVKVEENENVISINYEIITYTVDVNVSANVNTSYTIYKDGVVYANINGNGKTTIQYTVEDEDKYSVVAHTPYGYANVPNQKIVVSIDDEGIATAKDIRFNFQLGTLIVNITNMIPNTVVNLYTADGVLVQSTKTDSKNDITFYTKPGSYYVTVDWPYGYYKNTKHYDVETNGLSYGSGSAVAPTISPERIVNDELDKDNYFVLTIESKYGDKLLDDVTYTIYIKGSKTLAKDTEKNALDNIKTVNGQASVYLNPKYEYEVHQTSVPKEYNINNDAKYVKSKTHNNVTVVFDNELSDYGKQKEEHMQNIANKCDEARAMLEAEYAKLDKSKYSKTEWSKIEQEYARKMQEINTKCSVVLDENSDDDINFDVLFAEIKTLFSNIEQIRGHWMHIIIIIVSIIAIIISIITKKLGIKLVSGGVATAIDVVITLLIDMCIISILATLVHIVIQFIILIIHMIKNSGEDDDDQNPPEPKQPKKEKKAKKEKKTKKSNPDSKESIEKIDINDVDMKDHDDFINQMDKESDEFFKNRNY